MIIFCAGLRSSASTLQWQIALHIAQSDNTFNSGFIVNGGNTITDRMLNKKSTMLVVKQHKISHTQQIVNGNHKILMTVRDLRDVACSLMQRWHCGFDVAFQRLKVFVEHQKSWDIAQSKMLVMRYEDWIIDLAQASCDIANFLNIEIDGKTVSKICNTYSLESNRFRLHANHITDAKSEKYKKPLTPYQITQIENEFDEWLHKYNYM